MARLGCGRFGYSDLKEAAFSGALLFSNSFRSSEPTKPSGTARPMRTHRHQAFDPEFSPAVQNDSTYLQNQLKRHRSKLRRLHVGKMLNVGHHTREIWRPERSLDSCIVSELAKAHGDCSFVSSIWKEGCGT